MPNDNEITGRIQIPVPVEPPSFAMQSEQPTEEFMPMEETLGAEAPVTERKKNDMSDLFEVPQAEDNDIYTDDLVTVTEEDIMGGNPDLSDLVDVPQDYIMHGHRKPKQKRYQRTTKEYPTPMGGVGY